MADSLKDIAWKNFCGARGWERRWGKSGRFDIFVTLAKSDIGGPYPLHVNYSPLLGNGSDNCAGWKIPDRRAVIGVYLGREMAYKGQKRPEMVFATPTVDGPYRIYVAHSGIIDWIGDGDDEPAEQSGIRVDDLFVTKKNDTGNVNKRVGDQFEKLRLLI